MKTEINDLSNISKSNYTINTSELNLDKKIHQKILDGLVWSTARQKQMGGQSCGMPNLGTKLTHSELKFEISIEGFRSQFQAREFCMTVFELFLEETKVI